MKQEKQEINKWKVIAIIFIILFIFETLWILWGFYSYNKIQSLTVECLYDACYRYPDAWYDEYLGVCYCYEYDMLGELQIVETHVLD